MPELFSIVTRIKGGAVILSVEYGPEFLVDPSDGERLGQEMSRRYQEKLPETGSSAASCVVVIQAEVAASAIVRALYTLYQHVKSRGGQVFLAGYPEAYKTALATLGLLSLPGFNEAGSEEEALKRILDSDSR